VTDVTFVILSFEGPDRYSHAGGLGSRVGGLSHALADMGLETHLFFIGDPDLPGHETYGRLHLHRWCQWISAYHRAGVYDGEEGKLWDWNHSLPGWLIAELLGPRVRTGGSVVVLAEEWHTAGVILALDAELRRLGLRHRVHLVWNANNVFGFDRVPWDALRGAAVITTVSRYMKHVMWDHGVDARVIPNGIPGQWLEPLDRRACSSLSRLLAGRMTLVKVARWDPDKRWDMSVDAVALLKREHVQPFFLARGGMEDHGRDVLARARRRGLSLAAARWEDRSAGAFIQALEPAIGADMVVLEGYLSEPQRRVLFHVADAVLANSGIEPFGLVGLETMSVGGVAFVGCTGEEYVTHGLDAISLQTADPHEIVRYALHLRTLPRLRTRLRAAARRSAARYTWRAVVERTMPLFLQGLGVPLPPPGAARSPQTIHA
jgi:glycosyltransferase involved in cell wall biosynthesis